MIWPLMHKIALRWADEEKNGPHEEKNEPHEEKNGPHEEKNGPQWGLTSTMV